MITKETVLQQLYSTSNDIAKEFDNSYKEEINNIASELAISYQILHDIINREDQSQVSDADFQSALLFWTALNTYLAAVELFRRGYNKEPQMLIRNVLETFSAAFDIHVNPQKLPILRYRPKDFDSKKSINIAKQIHPIISQMWGMLSGFFSHVSIFHTVPHASKKASLCVGGLFESTEQKTIILGMLPPLQLALDIMNSVLELAFIKYIPNPRFRKQASDNTYIYKTPKENMERGQKMIKKMEALLQNDQQI